MEPISKRLKALRLRTRLSVRDVAGYLEFDAHSRYSYYESSRFKGTDLPVPLARKLAGLFAQHGVEAVETMALAGLGDSEAQAEAAAVTYDPVRRPRLMMEVNLPSEASLIRMFDAMLDLAGHRDETGELARTLAVLLPSVLAGTTAEHSGESLDPHFRPTREARSRRQTIERQRQRP